MNSPMTAEQMQAMIAQFQAENAKLKQDLASAKAAPARKVGFKVSEKGLVSLYGIGRFPASYYLSQWEVIIKAVKGGELERFIEANRPRLATKGE